MRNSLLEEKRRNLKKEIEIAQHHLTKNLSQIVSPLSDVTRDLTMSETINKIVENPKTTALYSEKIVSTFFPRNEMLNYIAKGVKLWSIYSDQKSSNNSEYLN